MKKTLSIAIAMAVAGISSVASAEDNMGLEFSANVALTSDYVFRGYSQADEDPAIQGGFDVAHSSGIYAGVWASNVESDPAANVNYDGASVEIDTYIGWGGEVGPVGVDVGWLRYNYPGTNTSANDTDEWHIGVSKDIGPVSAGLTYNYSSDFFADDNEAEYIDLSLGTTVGPVDVAAHYGWTDTDGGDYEDWSLGVSKELGGFGFDLTYTDTDVSGTPEAEDRVVFTISKSL